MPVIDIESIPGNAEGTGFGHFGTAGRTESAFASIADDMVFMAVRTFVDFKPHIQCAAGNHTINFITDCLSDHIMIIFTEPEKRIPHIMEDNMKGRFVGVIGFTESFGSSISDWFGKIISDHKRMSLIKV
jgi:hypothetical protein